MEHHRAHLFTYYLRVLRCWVTAEVSSLNRDYMTHKAGSIYSLGLYRKSLLIPGLNGQIVWNVVTPRKRLDVIMNVVLVGPGQPTRDPSLPIHTQCTLAWPGTRAWVSHPGRKHRTGRLQEELCRIARNLQVRLVSFFIKSYFLYLN